MSEASRRFPWNPVTGLLFAVALLLCAVLGWIALVETFGTLGDLGSRRAAGFLLFGPVIFTAVGVVTLVRAVRAWRPWRRYLADTPPTQRRRDRAHDLEGQKLWPLMVFGGLALAGQVAVLVAADPRVVLSSRAGTLVLVEINVLLATMWLACAGLLLQVRASRRPA